jgi:hypothetical protein
MDLIIARLAGIRQAQSHIVRSSSYVVTARAFCTSDVLDATCSPSAAREVSAADGCIVDREGAGDQKPSLEFVGLRASARQANRRSRTLTQASTTRVLEYAHTNSRTLDLEPSLRVRPLRPTDALD